MSHRRLLRVATLLLVVVVLVVTLYPVRERGAVPPGLCLICGSRGTADAILNVLLFAPLGVAVGWSGWSARRSYLAGVLLSSSIEFTQLFVPGRDSSLGDVLFNTLGVALGIFVARSYERWLPPVKTWRLCASAGVAALSVLGLTAYALQPSLPRAVYYGQWTPQLGHLEWYQGRVLEAVLGPLEIRSGRLSDSDSVRSLIRAGAPWRVEAVAGPPVPALASLVSVYDVREREIVLIGPARDDLVFRSRTRAASLRLDQPDLRLVGGVRGVSAGDTLTVEARRAGEGLCLSVGAANDCGLGFSLGHGWALLLYVESLPSVLKKLLNPAWLAVLVFPVAFWAPGRRAAALSAVALLAGLALIPHVGGLLATPPLDYLGASIGLASGLGLRWVVHGARERVGGGSRTAP